MTDLTDRLTGQHEEAQRVAREDAAQADREARDAAQVASEREELGGE